MLYCCRGEREVCDRGEWGGVRRELFTDPLPEHRGSGGFNSGPYIPRHAE